MDESICGIEFAGYPVAIGNNTGVPNLVRPYNDTTSFEATLDSLGNATIVANGLNAAYGCKLGDALTKQVENLRYQRSFDLCTKFVYETLDKKLCSISRARGDRELNPRSVRDYARSSATLLYLSTGLLF